MIITVRILKKPTVLAQQGGAVEEIVVQATDVVANDSHAATAMVAAANAGIISKMKSAEIKVVTSSIVGS